MIYAALNGDDNYFKDFNDNEKNPIVLLLFSQNLRPLLGVYRFG